MSHIQWPWKNSGRIGSVAAHFVDDDGEGTSDETSALNSSNGFAEKRGGGRLWGTISIVLVALGFSILTGMVGFYAGLRHRPDSPQAQHETYIDGLLGKIKEPRRVDSYISCSFAYLVKLL